MKKVCIWLLLVIGIVSFHGGDVFAIGNGEVVQGRQTFVYNFQLQDGIQAMLFDVEWGLTPTLGIAGRYVYASPDHYMNAMLKAKLIDNQSLKAALRVSLYSDFDRSMLFQKTLGIVLSKNQNSFLKTHAGFDYSLDTRAIGYFAGIDYQLTANTYFQVGWERFMTGSKQGLTLGLRADI